MNILARWARGAFLFLIYAFLLGPLAIIMTASFNSATSFPSGFERFTLHWYAAILNHGEFIAAARTSMVVAALAAVIATLVSFLAAYALARRKEQENSLVTTVGVFSSIRESFVRSLFPTASSLDVDIPDRIAHPYEHAFYRLGCEISHQHAGSQCSDLN